METSVVDLYFEVYELIAREIAVLRRFLNPLVDRGDIFLGNGSADGDVLELVTGAGFERHEMQLTVTVLSFTARLTLVHPLRVHRFAERFAVSDLRRADVRFHVEFAQKSVDDDIEVQFAHAGDDRLTRFLIGVRLERRILFP